MRATISRLVVVTLVKLHAVGDFSMQFLMRSLVLLMVRAERR